MHQNVEEANLVPIDRGRIGYIGSPLIRKNSCLFVYEWVANPERMLLSLGPCTPELTLGAPGVLPTSVRDGAIQQYLKRQMGVAEVAVQKLGGRPGLLLVRAEVVVCEGDGLKRSTKWQ